jgi:hypothetical protein
MARPKKGTKENPVTEKEMEDILTEEKKRPYKVTEAAIVDDFCNYKYEVTEGKGPYDKHKVDGKGIIVDDMREIFRKLRVHMAAVYGVFSLQGLDIEDIDTHHNDDVTAEFHVSGFKVKGGEDMESISLMGSKHIACVGGRMSLVTPWIDISTLSSYKWHNELKELADKAREEVALYKEGKYIVPDIDEDEEEELVSKKDGSRRKKPKQLSIDTSGGDADNSDTEMEEAVEETEGDDDFDSPL